MKKHLFRVVIEVSARDVGQAIKKSCSKLKDTSAVKIRSVDFIGAFKGSKHYDEGNAMKAFKDAIKKK